MSSSSSDDEAPRRSNFLSKALGSSRHLVVQDSSSDDDAMPTVEELAIARAKAQMQTEEVLPLSEVTAAGPGGRKRRASLRRTMSTSAVPRQDVVLDLPRGSSSSRVLTHAASMANAGKGYSISAEACDPAAGAVRRIRRPSLTGRSGVSAQRASSGHVSQHELAHIAMVLEASKEAGAPAELLSRITSTQKARRMSRSDVDMARMGQAASDLFVQVDDPNDEPRAEGISYPKPPSSRSPGGRPFSPTARDMRERAEAVRRKEGALNVKKMGAAWRETATSPGGTSYDTAAKVETPATTVGTKRSKRGRRKSIVEILGSAAKTAKSAAQNAKSAAKGALGLDSAPKDVAQALATEQPASSAAASAAALASGSKPRRVRRASAFTGAIEAHASAVQASAAHVAAKADEELDTTTAGYARRRVAVELHARLARVTPPVIPPTGVDPYSDRNPSLKAYNLNRRDGDPMPYAFNLGKGRVPARRGAELEEAADEQLSLLLGEMRAATKETRANFFRRLASGVDVPTERVLRLATVPVGRRPFGGGQKNTSEPLMQRMGQSQSPTGSHGTSFRTPSAAHNQSSSRSIHNSSHSSLTKGQSIDKVLERKLTGLGSQAGGSDLDVFRTERAILRKSSIGALTVSTSDLARGASGSLVRSHSVSPTATAVKGRRISEAQRRERVGLLSRLASAKDSDDGEALERELMASEDSDEFSDLSDVDGDGLVEGAEFGDVEVKVPRIRSLRNKSQTPELSLTSYLARRGDPIDGDAASIVFPTARKRDHERHGNARRMSMSSLDAAAELRSGVRQLLSASLITNEHAAALNAMLERGDLERVRSDVLTICTEMLVHDRVKYVEKDEMATLVHVVSAAERRLRLLRSIFDAIDENGDGDLSLEELESNARKMMLAAGATVPGFGARALFAMWDTDNSGDLDFTEFVAGMSYLPFADDCERAQLSPHLEMWTIKQRRAARRNVFATMDERGTGKLSIDDFDSHAHQLKALGIRLPHEAVKAIFSHWDLTGDGYVNFAEFETGLQMIETFTKNAEARAKLRKEHGSAQDVGVRITPAMMDQLLEERQHNVSIVGWLKKLPIFKPNTESAKQKTKRTTKEKRRRMSMVKSGIQVASDAPTRKPGIPRWSKRYFVLADDGGGGMFTYFRRDSASAQKFAGNNGVGVEAGIMIHDAKRGRAVNRLSAAERAAIQTQTRVEASFKVTSVKATIGRGATKKETFGSRVRRLSTAHAVSAASVLNVELPGQLDAGDEGAPALGRAPITFRTLVTFGPKDQTELDIVDVDGNVLTVKANSEQDAERWHRALRAVASKDIARQALLREAAGSSAWGGFIYRPEDVRDWTTLISSIRSPKREGITAETLEATPAAHFVGHRDAVFSMDWSSDGRFLVSGGKATELLVHSIVDLDLSSDHKAGFTPELEPSHRLVRDRGWISTVRFSPDMRTIASGGLDQTVSVTGWLFGADEAVEIGAHRGLVHCIRWSPDKQGNHLLSASGDTTCALWDVEDRTLVSVFDAHSSDVLTLATKDGDSNLFLSGSSDCMTRSWDIRSGQCTMGFNDATHCDVQALSFHPNGNHFIAAAADGIARVYDLRANRAAVYKTKQSFEARSIDDRHNHAVQQHAILATTFSADARFLYTCHAWEESGISPWCVWDAYTGDFIRSVEGHSDWITAIDSIQTLPPCLNGRNRPVSSLDYCITTSRDHDITLWEMEGQSYWMRK